MRTGWRLSGYAFLIGLTIGSRAMAQDKGAPVSVLGFAQEARLRASMQVFAVPNPVSIAAVRILAVSEGNNDAELLSPYWDLDNDKPIPLRRKFLEKLHDGDAIPDAKKPLDRWAQSELAFGVVRDEALIDCTRVPVDFFKKAAEANDYVTFDHLFMQPEQFRGQIVPLRGRLLRVRKWHASKFAQQNGVDWFYEGFVAGETPHRPPYYLLFTRLPEELKVRETMSVPVTFYGYYIMKLKYEAEKANRITNLLIGPTLFVEKDVVAPASTGGPFSRDVLYATVAGLFVIGLGILTMHWWFHRGDRAIQSKIAVLRERERMLFADETPAANGVGQTGEHADAATPPNSV